MNIWEILHIPSQKEVSADDIARAYYLHYIEDSMNTDPRKWIKEFDAIQNIMKSCGDPMKNQEEFLAQAAPSFANLSPIRQWMHEDAHASFAIQHGVKAQLFISRFTEDNHRKVLNPWVALNTQDLYQVSDLRTFLGGFLNAPSTVQLNYESEQTVADYLLGKDHPEDMKRFIIENA
jgi:hypothetical protein